MGLRSGLSDIGATSPPTAGLATPIQLASTARQSKLSTANQPPRPNREQPIEAPQLGMVYGERGNPEYNLGGGGRFESRRGMSAPAQLRASRSLNEDCFRASATHDGAKPQFRQLKHAQMPF